METKEAILSTALLLFNRDGASSVSTRHIADEMKISPGNLYYHYRNREEIVRVLMERMIGEFNTMFTIGDMADGPMPLAAKLVEIPVKVMYQYRFFYMEPVILLERDPVLKKIYFSIKRSRIRDFKRLYRYMTETGILVSDIRDDDFTSAFHNVWALNEFIIQSMYMSGEKITPANMRKSFIRILYIIKPFITAEYREKFFPGKGE
jgi:AcrR family transcriptional regulator